MNKRNLLLFLLCFLFLPLIHAQEDSKGWLSKLADYQIQPIVAIQLWAGYTFGTEVYDADPDTYLPADDRFNVQMRRSRLGVKGQPFENLQFNFTTAFDWVGNDILSGTEGGANNGANPSLGLWHAYVQWRVRSGSEALNVVAGYIAPQIGRESITAATRSTSMEKSWSQNYLRRHLVGTGPGRAAGINVGGLVMGADGKNGFGYDVGIFNPVFHRYGGNSTGLRNAPLLIGRLAAYIGDPESDKYTIGHKVNYFGKRQGLTVAVSGATQGATDLFEGNRAAGVDMLLNIGPVNIDGEWTYLWRDGVQGDGSGRREFTVSANTGYLRASCNINLKNEFVLEPVAMLMRFNGEMASTGQEDAAVVNSLAGQDQKIDIGFNLYPNPDLKLSLHYTLRSADAGAAGPGTTINNYFFQGGVGAIRRGDWLGLGLVAVF